MRVICGPIASETRPPTNQPKAIVWLINPNNDITRPLISSFDASWNIVRMVLAHHATMAPTTEYANAAATREDVKAKASIASE
jgi:hypothetical protein